jgi:hypothetical protein
MALLSTPTQPTVAKTEQHNRPSQGQPPIQQTKAAQAMHGPKHTMRHPKGKGHKTHRKTKEPIKKLARALKTTQTRNNRAEGDQFFTEF